MKHVTAFLLLFFFSFTSFSQMTAKELLEKSIKFHDPDNKWESFKGTLSIIMETPNSPKRDSKITIDLPNEYFQVIAKQGKNTTEYTINKEKCSVVFNGKSDFIEEIKKKYGLNCDKANLYKNYYTYLYGLPMKLKDPGTIIHKQVNLDKFMGEMYYVLKVTYHKEVGKDTWYFYFNDETYAMEAYQFYKDESKNDGEYILLSDFEVINGVKMPKKEIGITIRISNI